jgi:hypothetical protein
MKARPRPLGEKEMEKLETRKRENRKRAGRVGMEKEKRETESVCKRKGCMTTGEEGRKGKEEETTTEGQEREEKS